MPKGYGTLTSPQVVLQWGSPNGTGATVGNCGSAANVYIELLLLQKNLMESRECKKSALQGRVHVLRTDL